MFSHNSLKSFVILLITFFAICFVYYLNVISQTEGLYVYLIDDAYIHLAMAKNFAYYNVWGITKYEFSSTSSSPLFTYFLSILIKIFGNSDQIPLYCNAVLSMGVIYFLNQYFSRIFDEVRNVIIAVFFTLLFTVLHVQLLSGMEHVLHVFLFTVNIFCLTNLKNKPAFAGFYLTLLLMGLVRFESMFYIVILSFMLLLIKRWKDAISVLLTGLIPIAVFCYYNYLQDGYFFPNSVVVKGTKLSFDANFPHQLKSIFLDNFLLNVSFYKVGFFPIIMCLVFIARDCRIKNLNNLIKNNFLLIIMCLLMICHSMFADLKGLFRYESYILTGFCMALIPKLKGLGINFRKYIKEEKLLSVLVIINVVLVIYKISYAHVMLDKGGKNIYEQQMQSARFLNTYYNESKIVANDIGAISYFTNIHLLDTAGLGSVEMIRFNENKRSPDAELGDFLTRYTSTHKYNVAVIYDEWLGNYIPKNWKKAAELTIKDRITVARSRVSIYGTDGHIQELKNNIRNFNWNKNVSVTIIK